MKKFAAILALLLILCLAACDENENTDVLTNDGDTAITDIVTTAPETEGTTTPETTVAPDTTTAPETNTEPEVTEPVHVHEYTGTVTAPTCEKDGYTTHICQCGHSYTDSVVKATGHKYTSKVTAPTCTKDGYTTHTCTCGHSYTDSVTKATGHKYTDKVVKATCTSEGYTLHTCQCGDSYTDSKTSMYAHSYNRKRIEPTTTSEGYTIYTCYYCGDTYNDDYVPKLLPWTNTGGENDGTWHGVSGQNAGQLPSGDYIEDNYYKRPAPLTEGGNWDDFKNYIYETYGLFFFNNGIGKHVGGMQGTGMNSTAILNTEGRVSVKVFEWRKSYSSGVASNKILNVVLETFWFITGDREVAFALWSAIDYLNINGGSISNDRLESMGFSWSNETANSIDLSMNGVNIHWEWGNRENIFYFG